MIEQSGVEATAMVDRVFIVGSGIIGVCCGLELARRNIQVVFVDAREPGTAASFGNAGSIAAWAHVPDTSPEIFSRAARWMIERDGFVRMRLLHLPKMLPWLYQYRKFGSPERVKVTSDALASLVAYSQKLLWPLVERTRVGDIVKQADGLSVFRSEEAIAAEISLWEAQSRMTGRSIDYHRVSPTELLQLEPDLPTGLAGGLLRKGNSHVLDPGMLVRRWSRIVLDSGGTHIRGSVSSFDVTDGTIRRLVLADGNHVEVCGAPVIIAAGAWSHKLTAKLGHRVPLRASRGYHLSYKESDLSFSRPVLFEGQGFMMTSMLPGLRFAGTVEYDDPDNPARDDRIENLKRRVHRNFPRLMKAVPSTWMGARPSLPDSIPVLGRSNKIANAFFAFGHGSYGLTQSAGTGGIIADLVTNNHSEIDLRPFQIGRFVTP
jgi:D-amino-acid dehydrogenase